MEKEKGFNGEPYTKIPNQILEVLLQIKLQNYETRLLLAIARKTYGFNKNSDYINQKQLENLTGIKQSNISRTLKNLIEKKMIIKNGKQLSIQKDYKLWSVAEKEILKNISDEIYFNDSKQNENISLMGYVNICGVVLLIMGLIQIGFSIYYFYISGKKFIPERPKDSALDASVSVSGKLNINGIGVEKFIKSTDFYIASINITNEKVNKRTGVLTLITGLLTITASFFQMC